ncbi:MAG: tRNA pseudouridine(38-40) synthase TruA [Halocynthiibacter sp.]
MPRYALKIEYDGRSFAGWQRQKGQSSVQQTLESALRKLEDDVPTIVAAGRTDAGVHALAQVAHCDLAKGWTPFRLSEALNHHLKPAPVAILAVAAVNDDFSARFSAVERRYLFRLVTRRAPLTHERGRVWRVNQPLALKPMQAAARHLLGKHDFTTFRSIHCQAESPLKTLDALDIEEIAIAHGQEFRFHLRARSFLHRQVRSIVGTLERVGCGSWQPDDVHSALNAHDRAACGPVSPPDGLYLAAVTYQPDPFSGA